MTEIWESFFRDKKEMWGFEPADAALSTLQLFKEHGFKKILIPGFGYGRNAGIFLDNGFNVTGIEISETAIELAKKQYGDKIPIFHGSVTSMPYNQELYDGIFCYALIHLLDTEEREKLIKECYSHLRPGGLMVFIAISKSDVRYGEGVPRGKDRFETKHGVTLYFNDNATIEAEFRSYGLIEAVEINESARNLENLPLQRFWQIICRKESK